MSPVLATADLTDFFDGSCPLCRREIALYRDLPSTLHIHWVDVSTPTTLPCGLSCELGWLRRKDSREVRP